MKIVYVRHTIVRVNKEDTNKDILKLILKVPFRVWQISKSQIFRHKPAIYHVFAGAQECLPV